MTDPGTDQAGRADRGGPEAGAHRTGRTGRVVALLLIGAATTAIAALLSWVTVGYTDDLRGPVTATGTGSTVLPGLLPLAGVAVAALGALLAVRGVLRRLVGVLLVGVGIGVAVMAIAGFRGATGGLVPAAVTGVVADVNPIGPALALLGALALIGAGLLATTQRTTKALGSRYERSGTRRAAPEDPDLAMWKALDAHVDPTGDGVAEPAADTADRPPTPERDTPTSRSNAADG